MEPLPNKIPVGRSRSIACKRQFRIDDNNEEENTATTGEESVPKKVKVTQSLGRGSLSPTASTTDAIQTFQMQIVSDPIQSVDDTNSVSVSAVFTSSSTSVSESAVPTSTCTSASASAISSSSSTSFSSPVPNIGCDSSLNHNQTIQPQFPILNVSENFETHSDLIYMEHRYSRSVPLSTQIPAQSYFSVPERNYIDEIDINALLAHTRRRLIASLWDMRRQLMEGNIISNRGASQEVIERNTLTKQYQPFQRSDGEDCIENCVICLHEFKDNEYMRRLPCMHCFHMECIDKWLRTTNRCPICQLNIEVNLLEFLSHVDAPIN